MSALVSIIIPAWNAESYIVTSIRSALDQTHRNREVIVVDDGSSDRTAAVVRSVEDSSVRLVKQEHQGHSAAMNRGAAESRGDYLKFLDADDWINAEHIEAQLAAIKDHQKSVASCRWGYCVNRPELPRLRREHTNRDYSDPLEWLVDSLTQDEGMMGGWMWLMPRTVWDLSGGWDERLSLNNDFDFSIRLLLSCDGVRFAPDAVYSYRKGVEGALSSRGGRSAMESAFRTTESGCARLLQRESSDRVRHICADRWQEWLFAFYPEHPDLAARAETEVALLGGSSVRLRGGWILRCALPVLGWKRARRGQVALRRLGWSAVLRRKAKRRLDRLETGASAPDGVHEDRDPSAMHAGQDPREERD